jgi:hypothetical protein
LGEGKHIFSFLEPGFNAVRDYGITRERVRQICSQNLKTLKKRANLLHRFWRQVKEEIARKPSNPLSIVQYTQNSMFWEEKPSIKAFVAVLQFSPSQSIRRASGDIQDAYLSERALASENRFCEKKQNDIKPDEDSTTIANRGEEIVLYFPDKVNLDLF